MRRIVLLMVLIFITISEPVFAQNNVIYQIEADKNHSSGSIVLNIKSDYKENYRTVKESPASIYFDIKNAQISDNINTIYSDETGNISIVAQQIGKNARIYIKGENLAGSSVNFAASKGMRPFDVREPLFFISLTLGALLVAFKFYSATIKLIKEDFAFNTASKTIALNGELFENIKLRSPEIVSKKATDPIRKSVYADFQYAKNRKNIKIAI